MKYTEYLESAEWKETREKALEVGGYRCKACKSNEYLDVHHLNYDRCGKEEMEDLIVLCRICHSKWHKLENKLNEKEEKYTNFTNAIENNIALSGISTGFKKLDELTAGFEPSELIIIAGRPGMGKTAFALNILRNCAIDHDYPVGFLTLESTIPSINLRLLCTESRVNQLCIRTGRMSSEETKRIAEYSTLLGSAPIYITDGDFDLSDIIATSNYLYYKKQIKMLIIDYLQLIKIHTQSSIYQEMDSILNSLKILGKDLDIPVVVISQISRLYDNRNMSRRPDMSQLRSPGAIEDFADKLLFVYRPEFYDIQTFEDTGESTHNRCEIIIAKQRNGPVGTIRLTFLKEYGKFADPAPFIEESVFPDEEF